MKLTETVTCPYCHQPSFQTFAVQTAVGTNCGEIVSCEHCPESFQVFATLYIDTFKLAQPSVREPTRASSLNPNRE